MGFNKHWRSIALLCAAATAVGAPVHAAAPNERGAKIYREQCAKCHGRNGEGVKGKYNDALHGDWSLQKLTRYIDKAMPDDDPEKCVGPDAEAVAVYINEAFYSREARARNNPARVELVRLTNRQFVNSLADLLKSFSGADAPVGEERGLKASYRFRSKKGGEKKEFERVDRTVNVNFATDAEDTGAVATNEITVNWRGSLIAQESGEYQFVLKTPNGVRLWVNDDVEPLIDAAVASGSMDEHHATLKLIGGRVYPLRLEYRKAEKDKDMSVGLYWKPPHGVQELIPARHLTPSRSTPTFVCTTPFPADDSSVGYERGVSVSKAWDEATTQAAIETANYIARHLDSLAKVQAKDTNRFAKLERFCSDFTSAAFRRPLTDEQKRLFVTTPLKSTAKMDDAVKRAVLLTLKSPRFLYLGQLDGRKPDDFDVATRLSFGLWDSVPDRDLEKVAAQGQLHTPDQIRQQANRMLADSRSHSKMLYFLHQWLQVSQVDDLTKDATLYPGFTPEIIADLRASLNMFLEDVVWSRESDYRKLLLADYVYMNQRLAAFYGVSTNAADEFVKVPFDQKQRSGVITHPYLLSAFSYQKSTSPIHRGVFLTRNIVGRALKPPPMAVAFKDADFSPNLTMREKVAELTRPQACQTCHSVINPLGFSLEHYDAVGRFRTKEKDKPINAVSDYITDDGGTVRLSGARDVAQFAITSEHAQNTFVEQLFHQLVKQPMLAYGPDVRDRLRESFLQSQFNIKALLVDIVSVSALHGVGKEGPVGTRVQVTARAGKSATE